MKTAADINNDEILLIGTMGDQNSPYSITSLAALRSCCLTLLNVTNAMKYTTYILPGKLCCQSEWCQILSVLDVQSASLAMKKVKHFLECKFSIYTL